MNKNPSTACTAVGNGGVGESGPSAMLVHHLSGPTSKILVLRNEQSSLCPNTWAVASLVVNGDHAVSGNISDSGSSIQTEAEPGATVVAIVHAIPNFRTISCARLGELSVRLDECELVKTAGTLDEDGSLPETITTKDWHAWINAMPPLPNRFHVSGEVQVGNPGVEVMLVPKNPQGINSRILLMDLVLHQRPGIWPQIVVCKPAGYEKVNGDYDSVQIFYNNELVTSLNVEVIQ